MTDEQLQARIEQFNKTLTQYGRAKALHSALGSTVYEDETLDELASLLKEIQVEIQRRRNHEEEKQTAASS